MPPLATQNSAEASRSSRIGRNTLVNVAGAVFSILISLVTVPAYLHRIGENRYGVLAIVWVVLGYFAVFDLGLSRATANQIARMRDEPAKNREPVFWTAFIVNGTIGTVGGIALFFAGNFVLGHVLKISPALHREAIASLPWLGAAVPLTTVTLVIIGALEGRERFLTVNLLTITGLAVFQLAPLAYAYWVGPDLGGLIMAATLALLGSTVLAFAVTAVSLPLRGRPRVEMKRLQELLRYGGWITVTGLVGPILTVVDRIAIGSVLGTRAVTQYTVPFTLVLRTQILSSGLARTLFPRFSMLDPRNAAAVGRQSLRALAAVMTPVTILGAVALEPFLRVWVGANLAVHAAPVGEILLLGMWVNSLAVVPFAYLQAQGRPDLPAKFHVLEVAPYIGGLVLGLHVAGIRGAAWAWTARATADAFLLFWATRKMSPNEPANWSELTVSGTLVMAACVGSLTFFENGSLRLVVGGLLFAVASAAAFRIVQPSLHRLVIHRAGRKL